MTTALTRRSFLKKSSLVVAVSALQGKLLFSNVSYGMTATDTSFKPHAFVEIATDDTVTVWIGQTNLGQGTHTGISMIVAEELDADWSKVQPKMALAGEPFKDPVWHAQITGGSTSIRHRWDMIRKAGAAARQVLMEAAADQWGITAEKCSTKEGKVVHPDGRSVSYGKLVEAASKLPPPENPQLKNSKDYQIIGTSRDRFDIPGKVQGKAVFGVDFSVPGMCIALVARPPSYGAKPLSYDEKGAMAVKGMLKVIPLGDKIAVCAETTYAAMQGRRKLAVKWSSGSHPELDDKAVDTVLLEHLEKPGGIAASIGNANEALSQAETTLESTYTFPYVSHAQLEPINCTAHVEKDRCRIWVPTQGQTTAQKTGAKITGLPEEKVEVMTTVVGGGFGLRSMPDPVIDAVSLSQIIQRPVKVMWTREDDFANGHFRPAAVCRVKGGLSEKGGLSSLSCKVATPSIMGRIMPQQVQNGIDGTSVHGLQDLIYKLPNLLVESVNVELPINIGFWRSVGYSFNTFIVETFIDELAHAAKIDPVAFRLQSMEKESRPHRTLSLLAEKTGWPGALPEGSYRGVAVGSCFGSSAAHMAEVSVDTERGIVKVHKLVCFIDCGPAVYPDAIAAQMEGGAVMALSLAFHEKVHFKGGGVGTANFDEYPILTMSEVPEIEVHIAESKHQIGGVGELAVPTVAPAVANAIFQATGIRLRDLPFKLDKLRKG